MAGKKHAVLSVIFYSSLPIKITCINLIIFKLLSLMIPPNSVVLDHNIEPNKPDLSTDSQAALANLKDERAKILKKVNRGRVACGIMLVGTLVGIYQLYLLSTYIIPIGLYKFSALLLLFYIGCLIYSYQNPQRAFIAALNPVNLGRGWLTRVPSFIFFVQGIHAVDMLKSIQFEIDVLEGRG
jgi:hypothetical protein